MRRCAMSSVKLRGAGLCVRTDDRYLNQPLTLVLGRQPELKGPLEKGPNTTAPRLQHARHHYEILKALPDGQKQTSCYR